MKIKIITALVVIVSMQVHAVVVKNETDKPIRICNVHTASGLTNFEQTVDAGKTFKMPVITKFIIQYETSSIRVVHPMQNITDSTVISVIPGGVSREN